MDDFAPILHADSPAGRPYCGSVRKGGGPAVIAAALASLSPTSCRVLSAAALAAFLAGCAPDLGPLPEPQAPSTLAAEKSLQAPPSDWPSEDWWKVYGDPELDALVAEALRDSPSLKIAAARLRAAEAEADVAGANLWPTMTASGSLLESELSRNQMGKGFRSVIPSGWHHQAEIAADVGYELDLFGKNRAALAAATSSAEAAEADRAEARLQLSAGVTTAYAALVQLTQDRTLAENALRQRKESAALVAKRYRSGLENKGTLAMAEAQVWAAHGRLDVVERLIVSTRNQIAALLGKGPDRGLAINVPHGRTLPAVGLPENLSLNLIGRRPDIVAAKKRAQAAAKLIDVANANFYPDIQLVGQFGVEALDAKYLLTAPSEFGHFGPAITLPIFDYGRRTGIYRKARADYDAAVAAYDMTLTDGLRDVATAYNDRKSVEGELVHARAMLASAEEAYGVIRERYKGGLSPYIDVLTAETQLIDEQRAVADLEASAFAADVALKRALGGGYTLKN